MTDSQIAGDFARPFAPGDRISERYLLQDEVGRGGMAVVHRAVDERYDRTVAIKFLKPELSSTIGGERFRREIGIAATLMHPHIVPLHDSGEWNGSLYYVMPLIEGDNLTDVLKRDGPFSLKRALSVAHDVGEALAHAHRQGVVHRDIKPGNIILTKDYAVVTDFGVAKAIGGARSEDLTGTGMAVGTPRYMAPEQATSPEQVSSSADTYSLGCVVYEMLTGSPPFPRSHLPGLIADHLLKDPPSIMATNPDLPAGVGAAIHRALSKKPEERFDAVDEFVGTLEFQASVDAENRSASSHGHRGFKVAGVLATVASIGVLAALASPAWSPSSGWVDGRPESVLVLPFSGSSNTPEDRAFAAEIAEEFTTELNQWDRVRAVPSVVLSGPMFDRGISGPAVSTLDEAYGLAQDLGVAAVALVQASLRADSARVVSTLFDVTPRRLSRKRALQVGEAVTVRAGISNPLQFFAPMARRILGLEGNPSAQLLGRQAMSRVPEALSQADEGRRLLESWRLAEAEAYFRAAIALDSTFAVAQLRLAQTLYWRAASNQVAASSIEQEVYRASSAALEFGDSLPEAMRRHIRAFQNFAEGDYPGARRTYRQILQRDSTDVYAWLLLGAVEFRDPWLENTAGGGPRSNLNVALDAFRRAVRLQPSFQLGYGHIFDVQRRVATEARDRRCGGFETPRDVLIPPWRPVTPLRQEPFCLVAGDSLRWMATADFGDEEEEESRRGAADLLELGQSLLARWSSFAPNSSRPLEELARITIRERAEAGSGPPSQHADRASEAAAQLHRALALRADTLPGDLFRIANLHLAAEELDEALAASEAGFAKAAASDTPLPAHAANVPLASGAAVRVLQVLDAVQFRRFVSHPDSDRLIPFGRAIDHIGRARALGGVGLAGSAAVAREFDEIGRIWSQTTYSEDDRRLLRGQSLSDVLPALVGNMQGLTAWMAGLDLSDAPLARAALLQAADSPQAGDSVRTAAQWVLGREPDVAASFVAGTLASRVGAPDLALRLLNRIDSVPLSVDAFDARWGMRTQAGLARAEAFAALGDTTAAQAELRSFAAHWSAPDNLTAGSMRRAQKLTDALRRQQ